MTNSRARASSKGVWAALLVLCALAGADGVAEAGKKRVVVLDFEGPKSGRFHDDLVRLLKKTQTVISTDKWNESAEAMDASDVSDKNIKKVAKKLKVDAVVEGRIEKRRDEFILHLKLHSGTSGQVDSSVDTKAEGPKIDGRAQREIKDELLGPLGGGGGSSADDDDDKPAKGGKKADDDDDDAPKHGAFSKHANGKGGSKADDDDDKPAKGGKAVKKADDDDDKVPPKKAAAKGGSKADDDDDKLPAKGSKKPDDDDDKLPAKGSKKPDDDDKLPAKGGKKPDDDDDKVPPKKVAAKGVKKVDADDDKLPAKGGKKPAAKSDDAEDDDHRSAKRRVASHDDDGNEVEANATRAPLDTATALSPGERTVDADFGLSMELRQLTFKYTKTLLQKPPGYQGKPVPGFAIDTTIYPLSYGHTRDDLLKNIGINVSGSRVFKLNTQVANNGIKPDPDHPTPTSYHSFDSRFGFGGVFRYAFGQSPTAPVVIGGLGYSDQQFSIAFQSAKNQSGIPNVRYKSVEPSAGVRFPITEKIIANLDVKIMAMLDTGQIQGVTQYGTSKVTGFEGTVGADYLITPNIFARVAFHAETIGFTFQGNGFASNNRDMDPTTQDVTGARDNYFGGMATVGYAY
ncbi:MAG TPA: hypothetical protein VH165_25290 [Kofleriaceae bacterium]|nr:hypothetical protein [Kofleriaceae bacterium]